MYNQIRRVIHKNPFPLPPAAKDKDSPLGLINRRDRPASLPIVLSTPWPLNIEGGFSSAWNWTIYGQFGDDSLERHIFFIANNSRLNCFFASVGAQPSGGVLFPRVSGPCGHTGGGVHGCSGSLKAMIDFQMSLLNTSDFFFAFASTSKESKCNPFFARTLLEVISAGFGDEMETFTTLSNDNGFRRQRDTILFFNEHSFWKILLFDIGTTIRGSRSRVKNLILELQILWLLDVTLVL